MPGVRIQDRLLRVVTADSSVPGSSPLVEDWVRRLIERHTRAFTRAEFLKSVRALSARYVERRADLSDRPAIDSPGKRAAFAAFYAPLHLLTVQAVVSALDLGDSPVSRITDLGCGTGAAGAGWALAAARRPTVVGVDRLAWPLAEATWNWQALGVPGRTRRADLAGVVEQLARDSRHQRGSGEARGHALLFGWAINELDASSRQRVLHALIELAATGTACLIVEPIARASTPWWRDWEDALAPFGARSDDWKFQLPLPPALAQLDREAGFRRDGLAARSCWIAARSMLS